MPPPPKSRKVITPASIPSHPHPVRLAAIGDIHCTERSASTMNQLFANIYERADVLLLCGDITDRGRPGELQILINELAPSLLKGLTIVAVLGNHDCHGGQVTTLVQMMRQVGIKVLYGDDNIYVHNAEVGFAGIKGFWGGFSPNTIAAFGEENAKDIMKETAEDTRRLDRGLRSLSTPVKVAIMHYAPIKATLKGEPSELMNLLGSELLAKPLDTEGATICFHGHSHHGTYSGMTKKGVPVYNVAAPVLRRTGLQLPSIHTV